MPILTRIIILLVALLGASAPAPAHPPSPRVLESLRTHFPERDSGRGSVGPGLASDPPVHRGAWRQGRSRFHARKRHHRDDDHPARSQMILRDEQATADLGRRLAKVLQPGDTVTLSGPLGVGKTALVRAVIGALGHTGEVPSPTFAIVQPYEELSPPIWHGTGRSSARRPYSGSVRRRCRSCCTPDSGWRVGKSCW